MTESPRHESLAPRKRTGHGTSFRAAGRTAAAAVAALLATVVGTLPATTVISRTPVPSCVLPPAPPHLLDALVVSVVDGDTVRTRFIPSPAAGESLTNANDTAGSGDARPPAGVERVRLIGIDAPEMHAGGRPARNGRWSGRTEVELRALGRAAAAYARRHLQGRRVGLEVDVEQRDRYGRLLAYVWLADGTLYNARMVRDGYAVVFTVPPNVRYAEVFLACQREARAAGRGFW